MSFDRLAPHYRWLELVFAGRLMQRSRQAFLAQTRSCRHALLAGEGPGAFLAPLLAHNPELRATCLERSAGMIAQTRTRLARRGLDAGRVEFVPRDAREWTPPRAAFDLVATHFFLDCFRPDELARVVRRLAGGAARGSLWLLSDFQVPAAGWRRWRARCIVGALYGFFRLATGLTASRLTPPEAPLRAAGFALLERRQWSLGLVRADLWRKQTT